MAAESTLSAQRGRVFPALWAGTEVEGALDEVVWIACPVLRQVPSLRLAARGQNKNGGQKARRFYWKPF